MCFSGSLGEENDKSGVAVLSCTDCSGSSTSSDITDPGSPFSTASSHSEDSGSAHPTKMPPTQTAHHPPWLWSADEGPPSCKRSFQEKTAFSKRLKSSNEEADKKNKQSSTANRTTQNSNKLQHNFAKLVTSDANQSDKIVNHNNNNTNCKIKKVSESSKMQQGKITEYFRSQTKSIKKDCYTFVKQNEMKKTSLNKFISLVDQQTQFNSLKAQNGRKEVKTASSKKSMVTKNKKIPSLTVPRKILPAPSHTDKITIDEQLNNLANFTPTVTLTALSFPPNYTYLHTKAPKPADTPIFVPQFAAIANEKISIPIINRTPCLNVIQPVQKITTINNFNCVKLNATVVPMVKVNTLPSRINGSANVSNITSSVTNLTNSVPPPPPPSVTPSLTTVITPSPPPHLPSQTSNIPSVLSVETAVPTVFAARPKTSDTYITPEVPLANSMTPKPQQCSNINSNKTAFLPENVHSQCRMENNSRTEPHRTEENKEELEEIFANNRTNISRTEEKSPTPTTDSDSGISIKECLEVSVSDDPVVVVEEQKSPILSQPKTIRFPARQERKEDAKPSQQSTDGWCRWAECDSHFDTSGALLEHLQVKHVISQTTQEHYVCLWLGCKVHGRTSCSRSWLERHVLAHAGTKPFRCIVDGCGQRFNSQLMLERHVNHHFNTDGSPNSSAKKTTENNCVKLFKRNGKKIRFRRQPWSARMFDFMDSGIMEGLQHNLLMLTQKRTLGKISAPGDTVHLKSQILARRIEKDGSVKCLLRWHPQDVAPDEWVLEHEIKSTKEVSIPKLHPSSKNALNPSLFSTSNGEQVQQKKHRRKPIVVKRS